MPLKGDQRTPRTRVPLLITAFLIAVLSFGQPLAAYADPTLSKTTDTKTTDTKTTDTKTTDTKTTDNKTTDTGTPDTKTTGPSQTTSQTPSADEPTKTPPASGAPSTASSAKPSDTPSETPTAKATGSATPEASATPSDKTASPAPASATPSSSSSTSASRRVSALAISPLDCTGNTIYQIQRPTSGTTVPGKLNAVAVGSMSGTTAVNATQVTTTLLSGTSPGGNALGVTAGGAGAWALAPQTPGGTGNTLTFTLYSFDVTTEVWTQRNASIDTSGRLPSGVSAQSIRDGGIVAGAIDPLSGNFYWASLANASVSNSLTIFGWNTTTNTSIGVVANSTWPQNNPGTGSTNGDIAFDAAGNVYVVSNSGTNAALGVIPGPLPTTQPATTPTLTDTRLTTFSNPNSNNYNGIAFNATGDLFVEYSTADGGTAITKLNPQTGAVTAGPSPVTFSPTGGGVGVDLAACSNPPTLQLAKNVVNRQLSTDQFALAITGGDIAQGNTATTSGTATGVQAQTAGPVVARAGTTYTFTETGAGTTTLANYTTSWQCRNGGTSGPIVASGSGTTFTYTPTAGQAILCTFANSAPRLVVTKTTTATKIVPGSQVPYTVAVQNTGAVTATSVVVTDTLPVGLTFVSSSPTCTAVGQVVTCNVGTIAAGATSTINLVTAAANPFPTGAVVSGNVTNPVRVTSTGTNCPAGSTDTACTSQAVLPIPSTLTLVKTVTNDNGGTAQPTAWTLAERADRRPRSAARPGGRR